MAIRARRYSQAKAQAGTNLELAWWVFMRVSGLVLVFLVLGHLYMSNILINAGDVDYNYIARRLSNTTWKIYDWVMLSLSLLHGMNGLRYVLDDWVRDASARFWTKMVTYSLAVLVFFVGSMSLLNHDFSKGLGESTQLEHGEGTR
ncbi:succinate dehydrogenase hydrophobic membrane anchor subunit [Calidithermus timidus]|jgi:succinate dehydrogenase / fumarate reductase membrane anchor subunit|uniref:succinate dehydrogenase hydrophobic membrane anchor subunit n=1 Tax=Calidithermus timidus TaxID=307124 RepID=UPI0003735C6F|nr:succinate dehydrogenase hydrophobic membrane anchor subunit [Calidithermus timidus]